MAAAALALLWTTRASAQDWKPDTHRSGAGADVYLWALPDGDSFASAPIPFVNVEALDAFFIDAWVPWAFIVSPDGAAVGNPSLQLRYAPKMGITRWWIGGGIAAPIASTTDDGDWLTGLGAGAASMALYQTYLWEWGVLPIWATGGADIRVHRLLSLQFSGEPVLMPRIRGGGDGVEFALQNRAGVEARDPRSGVGGGAHLQVWWKPTDATDNTQFTIKPFIAYTGDVFFMRWALLFTLDHPLGPFFRDGRVFPQELVLGGQW